MEAILAVLNSISVFIGELSPLTITLLSGGIGFVIDLAARLLKTDKPKSIAWGLVGIIKGIATATVKIASVAAAVAGLLDKVLPQNINPPQVGG